MMNNIVDSYSFRKIPEWFCKTRSPVSVKPEGTPPFHTFHKKDRSTTCRPVFFHPFRGSVHFLKIGFGNAANRAYPGIGDICKCSSGSHAVVRIAFRRVIDIPADCAYIFIHERISFLMTFLYHRDQCLKWRTPVNTMAMPAWLHASMESWSLMDPPG